MSTFDPLDMKNYKVDKLPKMQKSSFEKWMARLGGPLAILAFVLLYWFIPIGFIDKLNPELLTAKALNIATYCRSIANQQHCYTIQTCSARPILSSLASQ